MCSNAEKLRGKIPDVEKNLEKSQNELANMISQENKATNEVVTFLHFKWINNRTFCCMMYRSIWSASFESGNLLQEDDIVTKKGAWGVKS